jgi:hypothetical protein
MRLAFVTTIFVLFLVLIFPAVLSFGISFIPCGTQPSLDAVEKVYDRFSVSQSFTSCRDNLSAIALTIKNPNLENKKDITMNLSENGKLIRNATLSGKNIPDGEYVKFIFDTIPGSKNKEYSFSLTAPKAGKDDSLQVYYSDQKPDTSGKFTITRVEEAEEMDGSISFVSLHKPTNRLALVVMIYSNWLTRFTSDRFFFVIYSLLILGLSGYYIYLLIRRYNK